MTGTSDFGVLYLIVDDPGKGQKALRDQGFSCRISDVVVIRVDDNGGILAVLRKLNEDGLNVEYMYTFTERTLGKTWMAFRCIDTEKALKTIHLLPGVQTEEIKDSALC